MNSFSYIFYDQFRIIVSQMTTSVALCLLAVTIISTLVLAHPLLVMSVVLVLALVFVNLLGNIILWDLDLNTISMINFLLLFPAFGQGLVEEPKLSLSLSRACHSALHSFRRL